jgi:hypothetical protein
MVPLFPVLDAVGESFASLLYGAVGKMISSKAPSLMPNERAVLFSHCGTAILLAKLLTLDMLLPEGTSVRGPRVSSVSGIVDQAQAITFCRRFRRVKST